MAVFGVEAQIADALLWYAGQVANVLGLKIAFPNVPFTPLNGQTYLEATFRPNITEAIGVPFRSTVNRQGLLQISVFAPAGVGTIAPHQAAARIAVMFKYGTKIGRNGVTVEIDVAPRVAPSMDETDWTQIPVVIAWRCLAAAA